MTREELARMREEELAVNQVAKDCFIIPQANLERFLPDGVTVSATNRPGTVCYFYWPIIFANQLSPKLKLNCNILANQFFNLECQPARGRFRYPLQQTARPKVGLVSGQLR